MSPSDQRPDAAAELRILHWNVHSWRDPAGRPNPPQLAALIAEHEPHLVSIVEVDEAWAGPSGLADVLDRTSGYRSVFVPNFEYGADGPAAGFGNALLSRLPIRTVRQRQLTWPPRIYDRTEPSEQRAVLMVEVDLPTGSCWVGVTHLPRSDGAARAAALRRLADIASALSEPWLLVGDFNVDGAGWLAEFPEWAAGPDPPEPSYPVPEPRECIDYCVRPRRLPARAEVLGGSGSDHFAVLVRCWLR